MRGACIFPRVPSTLLRRLSSVQPPSATFADVRRGTGITRYYSFLDMDLVLVKIQSPLISQCVETILSSIQSDFSYLMHLLDLRPSSTNPGHPSLPLHCIAVKKKGYLC